MVHTMPLTSLLSRAVHGTSMHHRSSIRTKHLFPHHTLLRRSERSILGLTKLFTSYNAIHRLTHRCSVHPPVQVLSVQRLSAHIYRLRASLLTAPGSINQCRSVHIIHSFAFLINCSGYSGQYVAYRTPDQSIA